MKMTMTDGSVFEGSLSEWQEMEVPAEVSGEVAETEEVLSEDNVKVGEYFVITRGGGHEFAIGEVVKAKSYDDSAAFKAENVDGSDWWYVYYAFVRRATAKEIAESTKPKEVKFEIGDVVKVGEQFAKVTGEIDKDGDYWVDYLANGETEWAWSEQLRHATEEEKSHLQTLIGRGKDEYKVGDLARLEATGLRNSLRNHIGCIFEVGNINNAGAIHLTLGDNRSDTLAYTNPEHLKLVVPVEYRQDFVSGD